jgi:signal transduction histidine kinase
LSAESQAGPASPTAGLSEQRQSKLTVALRDLATNAATEVGRGLALIYTCDSGAPDSARLRAAAGFANPSEARESARAVEPQLRATLAANSVRQSEAVPAFGAAGGGGTLIHPLVFEGRVLGALAVAWPEGLDQQRRKTISGLADYLSLRLAHDGLLEQVETLRAGMGANGEAASGDDLLRMSEALFAQDIELLRTNEKLSKVEKLKSDFIEKMSRELRTPLNAIIESIISVLTSEIDTLSDGARATLRSALDDGTLFLRTLQNILDLWQIKQGELPVEIQDVNFQELVDEAIYSVQDTIGDRPVRVEHKLEEPFPKLRTDLTKLNQILLQLLDNAAKFTPRGRIEIAARLEGGKLVCEVKDTGIGICHDDQQFVFDEFFQVDEASSRHYRGAGLGLTLVRDLILMLDGEISVSSEVGSGTSVRFQMPVQTV